MSRRVLRHFFDLHDPFFFPSGFVRPMKIQFRQLNPIERQSITYGNKAKDPHEIFQSFFDENGIQDGQRDFFKKNYPKKVQQKFDPFKVLGLQKDATEEQIKQAYRKLAIKYHPKNNTSPEAEGKFAELARAYEQTLTSKNQTKYSDLGFKSFFQDFDNQVQQTFGAPKDSGDKKIDSGKQDLSKTKKQGKQGTNQKDSFGQLFEQSSHVQNINGKQTKFVCEKKYKKDDKFLSVKRQETLKEDGKTEILQTIDDGKQVKKKQYILEKDSKQAKKIEQKLV